MSIYSVAQAEALTGIKAHTLRVWEKRYSFLTPERTSTNIRYYSDDQLRKLLNIGILLKHGYKISKIDAMSDEELYGVVSDVLALPLDDTQSDMVKALSIAMLDMDEEAFNRIFQKQINHAGLLDAMLNLIYPFLSHVGVLWGTNKLMPAQEHFVSCLIRQKLISALDGISTPRESVRSIAMFLPEDEMHEISLLLAAFIAKDLGWKVYYLGANVPYYNLKQVAEISECDVMMSMSVVSTLADLDRLIQAVTEATSVPFLLSGSLISSDYEPTTSQVVPIHDPFELIRFLKAY